MKIKTNSKRVWRSFCFPDLMATQSYYWVNRVIVTDESLNRKVVADLTLEEFQEQENWTLVEDWEYD